MDELSLDLDGWTSSIGEGDRMVCHTNLSRRISALNLHLFGEETTCVHCIYIEENNLRTYLPTTPHTCLQDWRVIMSKYLIKEENYRTLCLCGMWISEVCYIKRETSICRLGNVCIKRFGTEEIINDNKERLRRIRNNLKEKIKCERCRQSHPKILSETCMYSTFKKQLLEMCEKKRIHQEHRKQFLLEIESPLKLKPTYGRLDKQLVW